MMGCGDHAIKKISHILLDPLQGNSSPFSAPWASEG